MEVILVEPENPGNVGAVARCMKNFGFSDLVLVNPCCDHLSEEAIVRSKHGKGVLESARVTKKIADLDDDILIATTGKLGSDYSIQRNPISPKTLGNLLDGYDDKRIGIVFGRESRGLDNKEIEHMDFVVSIPADDEYKVLNLSHATAIILYEIFSSYSNPSKTRNDDDNMSKKDKEIAFENIESIVGLTNKTDRAKISQRNVMKKMIGRSMLSKREGQTLIGFLRNTLKRLK